MQPPALERRSALYKAQSLGSSLIHTIPATHQRLPCLEDTALLITRYQPPHSGLPCVEDTLSFTWYQPHISGCRVWKTLLFYSHDTSLTSAAAVCRGLRSLTHSRWHGAPASVAHPLANSEAAPASERQWVILCPSAEKRGVTWCPCEEKRAKARSHLVPLRGKARRRGVTWCPCAEKCAKAISHLVPLRGKAREGGESPDAPAQKSARRRGVTWCPCTEKCAKARSHLMPRRTPYQPSRFRWTITSVVHAPTKWCSTRSYSIVTVRSDRSWCISAQRSGAAHSRLPPSPVKKQQTMRSRSSLAHGSTQCRVTVTRDCSCQEPDVRGKV